MPSNKPSNIQPSIRDQGIQPQRESDPFLSLNEEPLQQLLTFIDFAQEDRLTIGFVSTNDPENQEKIIRHIQEASQSQDIQLALFDFPDPELRFLLDDLTQQILSLKRDPSKKLVIIVTGLEHSIGIIKGYPPVLTNLNYVRDAFPKSVPYPILFFLPDYALDRLAIFAPDFWAWRLAVIEFCDEPIDPDEATTQIFVREDQLSDSLNLVKQDRITLLQNLLDQYIVDHSDLDQASLRTRLQILNELAVIFRDLGETAKSRQYFNEALSLFNDNPTLNNTKARTLAELSRLSLIEAHTCDALEIAHQSLDLFELSHDTQGKAYALNNLAQIFVIQGEINQAVDLWKDSLELYGLINDSQGQSMVLNNVACFLADKGKTGQATQAWQINGFRNPHSIFG